MNKRFIFELIIGVALLASILIFGHQGMVALVLLALLPLINKKKKFDEREIQLFYKIGNITAAATFLFSAIIYYLSDMSINGETIGTNWLFYLCAAFLISHGVTGLVILSKE